MKRVLVDLLSYTGTKGGMETYTRELYRTLGALDTEFTFVGFGSTEFMALDHSWFPGQVIPSGVSGENRVTWAYGELFEVSRCADKIGADLVHCPALLGPLKTSMPTVITMHDLLYFSHPELMTTGWYTEPVKWMERGAARNASRIMTDSETSASEIRQYLKYPPERLDVVVLAGTAQAGASDRPRVLQREPKGHLILATGNRRPHKNWEGLVRALALVEPDRRPRLVVTGSHGEDPLLPVVEELGLEEWVELRSWVSSEELSALYEEATALAMPSFCDGFSLPALDAMTAGLPVMISDIPVYREVTGEAAIYFDPTDLGSIATAIERVVMEPETLEVLISRGFAQAGKFSWSKVAAETLETFRMAMADPR